MTISPSLPLGVSDLEQSGELSSAKNTASPGDDFSVLLFLILGTPQLQNVSVQGDPQLASEERSAVVFDAQGTVAQSEEVISAGGQTVSIQVQEPLVPDSNNSVSADTQEISGATRAPINQIQFLMAALEEPSSVVAPGVPAQPGGKLAAVESGSAAALAEGNLLNLSVLSAPGQNVAAGAEQGSAPARIDQKELNSLSRQNPTVDRHPGISSIADPITVSETSGPRDQKTANVPIDNGPDKTILAAPATDFAVRQTPLTQATIAKPNSTPFLSPLTDHEIKDAQFDTPPDISMTNSGSNKINGNLESAASVPKALGAGNQNAAFAFDDHGEQTFSEASRGSHDHSTQLSNSSVIFPSIGMPTEESPKSADTKSAVSWPPVMDQVAGGIAANLRQNKHEAVIALDPPELGSLKINLTLDGGKVQVHIIAESHESRNLIENHLSELKQALQVHSLDLVDARVDGGSWNGTTGDLMHGFQHQPNGRQQSGWNSGNPSRPQNERAEIQRPDTALPSSGRVSMWA